MAFVSCPSRSKQWALILALFEDRSSYWTSGLFFRRSSNKATQPLIYFSASSGPSSSSSGVSSLSEFVGHFDCPPAYTSCTRGAAGSDPAPHGDRVQTSRNYYFRTIATSRHGYDSIRSSSRQGIPYNSRADRTLLAQFVVVLDVGIPAGCWYPYPSGSLVPGICQLPRLVYDRDPWAGIDRTPWTSASYIHRNTATVVWKSKFSSQSDSRGLLHLMMTSHT